MGKIPTNVNIMSEKSKNFLTASFIVFVLFFLSLLMFESTWGINDDVFMAMTVSGKGFSNKPIEHIVYSNIIIGSVLKKMYQVAPLYSWYGFYTLSVLFVSFVVLLYSLLSFKYSKSRILYFFLYFILFGLFFIRGPEFTANAFMLGMSGAFLFIAGLRNEKILPYKILLASLFLLSVSSLVRLESFFLVVILSLPVIIIALREKDFNKQIVRKSLLFSIALALIVFTCHTYDKYRYSEDNRWAYVLKKAELRGELVDNNKMTEYSSKTRHIFNAVGWSVNDFFLMKSWFSADDRVFSRDNMEKVYSGFKGFKNDSPKRAMVFEYMLRDLYFYGSILLIIFFIMQTSEKGKNIFEIIIAILISLFIIVYLGYYIRLPSRVYMCVLSFLSFLTLFFTDINTKKQDIKQLGGKIKYIFILLFVCFFIYLHHNVSVIQEKCNFLVKYSITQLRPASDDRIFLVWGRSLPLEFLSVFDNLDDFSNFRMLPANHRFNDPISTETLKDFGAKTFSELMEKDNLYHIGNHMYMALYSRYLNEHYNRAVAFEIYMENPMFMVYRTVNITPDINNKLKPVLVKIKNQTYKLFVVS